jgi:hypothetical protein
MMVVGSDANTTELLEFVETLRHECENVSLHETWQFCGGTNKWYTNWPPLMILWQKFLVIPSSIANCKRIFSKECYQEPLASFIEVGHFDASISMWNRIGEYGLVMPQHEESMKS